jgi:hypothetical protein
MDIPLATARQFSIHPPAACNRKIAIMLPDREATKSPKHW